MKALNVEVKARCADLGLARERLMRRGARSVGTDHQVDTYFLVPQGRLKLREGNIERTLIFYDREDESGPKTSNIELARVGEDTDIGPVLRKALGTLVVVDKVREIFFIDNVKFHLDTLARLGTFVEIEAIDTDGSRSRDALQEQCESFMNYLNIAGDALVQGSYSDMLLSAAEFDLP